MKIDKTIQDKALARINACKASPLREAMRKNLEADAFADADHLEANLVGLEKESARIGASQ